MSMQKAFDILKECSPTVSVGILSADLTNLGSEVASLEAAAVRLIHFDVMDGCFVPMMTAGPPLIKAVKTRLLKDVHLLIRDPEKKAGDYVAAGADMITVHAESCDDVRPLLRQLGTMENANDSGRGLVRGVAVNPGTPVATLESLLDDVEMVVVLAVDPNAMRKGFVDSTADRVARIKEMVSTAGREILICVDGGVKLENIAEIAAMGPDIVVSGSAVFAGRGPAENVRLMLETLRAKAPRDIR